MTKRRKRIPRPARCPTIVAMALAPEVELTERMALEGFLRGWADRGQFNILADCRDLLTLAAAHKGDAATLAVCEAAGIALENIRDRYHVKARMGCTADERAALVALVDVAGDFWKRQSGELFRAANVALDKARGFVREARLA